MIPFGPFAPDQPALVDVRDRRVQFRTAHVRNMIPALESYLPFKAFSTLTTENLPLACRGGAAVRAPDGTVLIVVGTAEKLYLLDGDELDDVTNSGGDYNMSADQQWRFVLFGDILLATNIADDIQFLDLTSPTAFDDFVQSTLVPKAKYIAIIGDFVVIAYTEESSTVYPYRVRWSKLGAADDFDESEAAQSDFTDLLDGGHITGIVGNTEYGIVIQENMVRRMDYVSGQLIFRISKVQGGVGSQVPESIIGHEQDVFYYSPEGFKRYNGSTAVPIGAELIDRFFYEDFDYGSFFNMSSGIDPVNKTALWCYASKEAEGGVPDRILMYRWDVERFSIVAGSGAVFIFGMLTQGYTLEDLNAFGTLDTLPASLDSPIWQGGALVLGAVNADGFVGAFSGDPLDAEIDTAEMELTPGMLTFIERVRPLVDGDNNSSVTVAIIGRNTLREAPVASADFAVEPEGHVSFDGVDSKRYQRFRMKISGGFNHAIGFDDIKATGDGML